MSDSPDSQVKPLRVSKLDVAEYPPGRQTRLLVEPVHDGVGHAIRVPVVVFRGARSDGPVFGVTAALTERGRHVITCSIEHPALEQACLQFESAGGSVTSNSGLPLLSCCRP